MIDINKEEELIDYLTEREWLSPGQEVTIESLSGGVSCKVIKVSTQSTHFVVKQALHKLKVKEDWFSDIRRIIIERNGLDTFHQIVPESVPALLFYDDENYLYAMEAAPNYAVPWKTKLLNGEVNFKVARQAALSLAKVHSTASRNNQLKEIFKNQQYYIELRIDPYLRTISDRHPALRHTVEQVISMLLETKMTLVHGDFSPKNILVANEKIYILDYEVAHIGHPSFDLGFFTNHLLLKAVKNKQWAPSYLNLMNDFATNYLSNIDFTDASQLERETVQVLGLLFLARVDGKSPAEYITEEQDKDFIRSLSYQIIDSCKTYQDVSQLLVHHLNHIGG